MAVRIKDGMIPYTWWIGIEITDNHVINVLLRELNNLIQVNGDNELYVDLQLADNILPTDNFPVGVTTWRILQGNGWQQSWLILNRKTTSGDYTRLIYANDGRLYYDPWTWVWNPLFLSGDIQDLLLQVQNIIDAELSNYYTKQEVNELLSNIAWLEFIKLNDVSDLPAVWSNGIIYLVPNSVDPTICDMYVWISSTQQYEVIGTTAVDMSGYVTLATIQTISWKKTFSIEPVLPNKTTDATNDGTKPATEAQVYKVAQSIPTNLSDLNNDLQFVTASAIWDGTITIKQWWTTKGTFSVNQNGNTTINLDAGWGWWWGWASVSDTPYWPSWNWVTNVAPSKNAVYDKIESLNLEQDVRVWNIPQNWFTQAEMEEICLWCYDGWDYERSAILKSTEAWNKNLYVYWYHNYNSEQGVTHYYFYWMWEKHGVTTTANWDFTTTYNSQYHISFDWDTYVWERQDTTERNGNYLTVENSNYTTPYIPTADYQPATKKYVDDRNWVWTQAQYDALVSGWQIVQWVIYNIISSS